MECGILCVMLVGVLGVGVGVGAEDEVIWCKRSAAYKVYPTASSVEADAYSPTLEDAECVSPKYCLGYKWTKPADPTTGYFVGESLGCDVTNACEDAGVKNGCKDLTTAEQTGQICCCKKERCNPNTAPAPLPTLLTLTLTLVPLLIFSQTPS